MGDGTIRPATVADVPEILELVRALAEYEREPGQVEASEADLSRALFEGADTPGGSPAVWGCVVEHAGPNGQRLGGIALWFLTFSTWTGRHGVHLEDLFVRPELRGRGYGARLLGSVAQQCAARGYPRLEWSVLTWNSSAIDFYRGLGASPMDGWVVYRLTGDALGAAAESPGRGSGQ
ncbi:MAG: GNAT family N-acetyltransferase [Actinomycetes bacterium]